MYISQCLIVKNEEKNIEHCLTHLKSVVDEQIVIDTGSTDRTVEIAKKLGAKVFYFEWIEDFSAARNYAIEKAKGDWIIFLDSDEYFSEESIPIIKKCIHEADKIKGVEGLISEFINIRINGDIISTVKNVSPRIFRRKGNIRYVNRVHEILANVDKANSDPNLKDVSKYLKIFHTGYDDKEVVEKNKNERNLNLLEKEIREEPENAKLNYYLSRQYNVEGKYEEALLYAEKALKYIDKSIEFDYYCTIYSLIMTNMLALNRPYSEIKIRFDEAVTKYPKYPDYYRIIGLSAAKTGKIKEAIKYFENCINLCENYKGNAESLAVGKIFEVYIDLLRVYEADNNKHKIVEVAIALLKVDKYNFQVLTMLIKTFLTQEKEENIVVFLSKLYDYDNVKDKMVLIRLGEVIENNSLKNYYLNLLNDKEKEALIKSGFLKSES